MLILPIKLTIGIPFAQLNLTSPFLHDVGKMIPLPQWTRWSTTGSATPPSVWPTWRTLTTAPGRWILTTFLITLRGFLFLYKTDYKHIRQPAMHNVTSCQIYPLSPANIQNYFHNSQVYISNIGWK